MPVVFSGRKGCDPVVKPVTDQTSDRRIDRLAKLYGAAGECRRTGIATQEMGQIVNPDQVGLRVQRCNRFSILGRTLRALSSH